MTRVLEKICVTCGRFRNERELRILNLPVLQYGSVNLNGASERYAKLFPRSFESRTLDKILRFIPVGHDHIWICRSQMGEAHILNYMIDELILKYHAQNPCFVSDRAEFKEVFALYNDIPFYPLNLFRYDYVACLTHRNIEYKSKFFHVHHCTYAETLEWDNNAKSSLGSDPSVAKYLRFAGINGYADVRPGFNEELKLSALLKAGDLDLGNFVFVVPESRFCTARLDARTWADFTLKLRQKHIDVFVNTASGISTFGKSARLNVAEAAYLASKARVIVGLRCGFMEVLAAVRERGPLYALYPHFRQITPAEFQKCYTLKNYPFYNKENTFERLVPEGREREVLNQVLEEL